MLQPYDIIVFELYNATLHDYLFICPVLGMVGTCLGHVWDMSGACLRHVLACLGSVWGMLGICLGHAGICLGHVLHKQQLVKDNNYKERRHSRGLGGGAPRDVGTVKFSASNFYIHYSVNPQEIGRLKHLEADVSARLEAQRNSALALKDFAKSKGFRPCRRQSTCIYRHIHTYIYVSKPVYYNPRQY